MTRQTGLLAALGAVLLLVLFYIFVWSPRQSEIDEVNDQISQVEQERQQLEQQAARLREVRNNAPEAEAAIVAAESIVPRDLAIPGALRQFQLASDESGASLFNLTFSRPAQLEDAEPGLAAIDFNMQIEGGYYQIIDALRRIEDPAITPRGVVWSTMDITEGSDGYPTLSANVGGRMFALLPTPPAPPAPEPADEGEGGATDAGTEPTEAQTEPGEEAAAEDAS